MTSFAKPIVSIYDTKPYDRDYLTAADGVKALDLQFRDFRLEAQTASSAEGAKAICVFVNDNLHGPVLEILARLGIRMVALRCAGFNNVDLKSARRLGVTVTHVPNYSPYAVAEYTIALILTLNRKTHRAFNRVRA